MRFDLSGFHKHLEVVKLSGRARNAARFHGNLEMQHTKYYIGGKNSRAARQIELRNAAN